ncbi:MAG: hypothetical protein DRP51_02265 [Candidatus Zixiibacteriota bacterium]|nr:MAG: hypothetical protein DRP51_02265 [candidate division Zixibacteria bacterium]HHI03302.1 TetR family transcriptional regulator [candidate division Zixibacteria bacterium]
MIDKEKILEEAEKMLARFGTEKTTMNEIAREAGQEY